MAIRLGGQYVKKTSPIRSFRGTVPQTRESHDDWRLSPIMKYRPLPILSGGFVSAGTSGAGTLGCSATVGGGVTAP